MGPGGRGWGGFEVVVIKALSEEGIDATSGVKNGEMLAERVWLLTHVVVVEISVTINTCGSKLLLGSIVVATPLGNK